MSFLDIMLNPGEIIVATVVQVEVYGIYLSCRGHRLVVFVHELDWVKRIPDCRRFTSIGDELRVKVLRRSDDAEDELYLASIKQVDPSLDPWQDPTRFCVGSLWQGKVTALMTSSESDAETGYFVELCPGVVGVLWRQDAARRLCVGEGVDVEVASVDVERRVIDRLRTNIGS